MLDRLNEHGRKVFAATQAPMRRPWYADIYPAVQLREPTISEMQLGAKNLKLALLTEACRPELERWRLRNPEKAYRIKL